MSQASSDGALRLFIAVRPSLTAVAGLGDEIAGLRRSDAAAALPAAWVAAASYHVTLSFLGWTRPEAVEAIKDRVGRALAGARSATLVTGGLGAFPSAERARVLWIGVDDAEGRIAELAGRVQAAACELGFPAGRKPFHPHLSVARLRSASDVQRAVSEASERLRSRSSIDSVVLYESTLKSSGSEYTPLAEWRLESPSKPQKRQTRPVEPEPRVAPGDAPGHVSNDDAEPGDGPA
jgi:2'-5' RNA ligase